MQNINLNDNTSFARNYKGRLFNADPQEELEKQRSQEKYKEALRIQMEEDKRRKLAQKAREEEQDLKHQRKFYEGARIEAQQKANKKEEPNYFVMRTAKGRRKKLGEDGEEGERLGKSAVFGESIEDMIVKRDMLKRTIY